jgi:uncharacterized damage-inducible protein DinB
MSDLETLREWFRYLAESRRKYFATLEQLPREEQLRDRGASFPTLLAIFEHSVGARVYWFHNMSKNFPDLPQLDFGPIPDPPEKPQVADVARLEREVDVLTNRFLDALTPKDLERHFPMKSGEPPSVRDALWHLVEEELQHRGEMNALLWQIDVDPPILDWIEWAEARPSTG